MSNGNFDDQTYAEQLVNDAGELNGDAVDAGTGTQPYFELQWDFASSRPLTEQENLVITASPVRSNTGRMSFIAIADTPAGLRVDFADYQRSIDDFVTTVVASSLDRTQPHTIRLTVNFIDGPTTLDNNAENDIVCVYVDNVLRHQGTSWENYFRDNEAADGTRTVDSVLFRTGGGSVPQAPALSGQGFLIDNMSISSGPVPLGAMTGCPIPTPPSDNPTTTQAVASQPLPPCSLVDGGVGSIIRADAPANVYCRILAENGSYVRNAAEIGDINLINQGVLQAADIFAFGSSGEQLTTFGAPIKVCLQGAGQFYFRDANGQPRVTALLPSTQEGEYTCAIVSNPGTVILA